MNWPTSFLRRWYSKNPSARLPLRRLGLECLEDRTTPASPVAVPDSFSTAEDTPLVVAAPGVLGNDTDADGDPLTAAVVTNPTNGSLALNADGSFTYTPNANYNGPDSFTYLADDGTSNSATTVSLVVTAVNDAPVAAPDIFVTSEDTPLVVAAPGVLGNDTDADGNPLTAVLVTNPTNGSLVFSADGSFTYTPNANYNGPDSFTYRANDGTTDSNTVTVNLFVIAVNDAPVAAPDTFVTSEDTPLVVAAPGVLGNDTDADGNPLTAVLVTGPANGSLVFGADGSFTYAPNADFNGSDSFTYVANDGTTNSNTATVSLTVTAANDAPVITSNGGGPTAVVSVPENGTAVTTVTATDTDLDALTYSITGGADAGRFTINGSTGVLTFNTGPDFEAPADAGGNNVYDVIVSVTDGTVADTQAIAVAVTNSVSSVALAAGDSSAGERGTDEAADPGQFVLTRTGDISSPLTVGYTIGGSAVNGDDYQGLSGVVTFAAGSATAVIDVSVLNDSRLEGIQTVTVTLQPGADYTFTPGATEAVTLADNDTAPKRFAAGGAGGMISVFDNGSQTPSAVLNPYPGFTGSVAVAVGDVDGDGIADIATVISTGGPALVKVFDGVTGAERLSFLAFSPAFTIPGTTIGVGDLNGDGRAEIVVGTGSLVSAVLVFDGLSGAQQQLFLAFPGFPIGGSVAVADLDGDGTAEIVVGATSGLPVVAMFDGSGNLKSFFLAVPVAGGAQVGTADLDGDGSDELLVGASFAGVNAVLVYNSDWSSRGGFLVPKLPTPAGARPLTVTGSDLDGDGKAELLVGVGSFVGVFDGLSLDLVSVMSSPGFAGGVYVG